MTLPEPRQRHYSTAHISPEHGRFAPELRPATGAGPAGDIAVVDIIDGLVLQSDDPEVFRTLAELFDRAADSIDTANKVQADRDEQDAIHAAALAGQPA